MGVSLSLENEWDPGPSPGSANIFRDPKGMLRTPSSTPVYSPSHRGQTAARPPGTQMDPSSRLGLRLSSPQ